jgi:hypothetical protein
VEVVVVGAERDTDLVPVVTKNAGEFVDVQGGYWWAKPMRL